MNKSTLAILLILAITLAGCSGGTKIGKPEIKSISHRWGAITDDTSEILTDIVVYNPNPIPIPIKSIQIDIYMNNIKMGEGKNIGSAGLKANGDTTIKLSTKLDNRKIPEWWVSHLKHGESTKISLKGNVVFDLKITEFKWPFEQSSEINTDLLSGMNFAQMPLNIGPIQLSASISSRWGEITAEKTEIIHDITLHNPNNFPIPITRMDYEIYMNNIKMGEGSTYNPAIIAPKGDTKLVFASEIINTNLDEWWVSHLKNGERTIVKVKIMPTIEVRGQKLQFTLIEDESEFSTNILS
jgi:LEA14-like dessication related protein